ncbi:MAG TPA: MFS transporter [Roseiflexaceae bacterium]|nr:MFS transporter [Roseiflexaceae bacterium]
MDHSPARPTSPWRVLAVTGLAVFAVMLDSLVLLIAFPAIQRSFPALSSADLSWVLNSYTIVYGTLLVPAGSLADRLGRRRMFLVGAALFTVASLLCGLAPSVGWLIGLRALQGVGGALLSPAALALVLAAFPLGRRTLAVAVWGAIGALAVVAGPPLGSWVVQVAGWEGIFYLNLPIGLAALGFGRQVLAESRNTTAQTWPDLLGAALLSLAAGLITLGLVQSEVWGWDAPATLGALIAGLLILGVFLLRSRAVANPVLDLRLFEDQTFRLANLANVLFGIVFTAMFFGWIQFLTRIWGYSLLQAGLAVTPGPLMVVLGAPLAGRLAMRWGHRNLLVAGGLLYAAGALVLLARAGATPQFLTAWLPGVMLTGLGVALIVPLLSSAAVQHLPSGTLASGSGVFQALRQFASVLGVALTVLLLGSAPERAATFAPIFALMAAGGLCVSAISLRLPAGRSHTAARPEVALAE